MREEGEKVEDEEEEAERRTIGRGGGGEGDKNVVWEQIKVLQARLDRRRGGVGGSNTLRRCIHYNRIWDNRRAPFQSALKPL